MVFLLLVTFRVRMLYRKGKRVMPRYVTTIGYLSICGIHLSPLCNRPVQIKRLKVLNYKKYVNCTAT